MLSIPKRTPRPRAPLGTRPVGIGEARTSQLQLVRLQHRDGVPGLTLAQFVSAAWDVLESSTPLQWNWHLDTMCEHLESLVLDRHGTRLEALVRSGTPLELALAKYPELLGEKCPQNLMINVPPGSMKSMIFSVFLPAWVWLFRPSWRAIYASNTPTVVSRDSLKCRTLIRSDWYQKTFSPAWQLSSDQDEKQHFANTAGGFRKGVAAGGAVTGERADFLGVDDPNDAKEITSKAHREQINVNWWDSAFHNRIANPTSSKRAAIMQRLHEEDFCGYVIGKEKATWAWLSIPMEAEADADAPGDRRTWLGWSDPRKLEGELMFPERFDAVYCEKERITLGSAGYAGQMQQRPVAASGNRFMRSWWRFWSPTGEKQVRPKGANDVDPLTFKPEEDLDRCFDIIASWDCTFKDTDGTDYVVGGVVAIWGSRRIVLERVRARMSFPVTKREIKAQHERWPQITETLVEDKANGPAVVKDLESEIAGLLAVEPEGGKEARAAIMEPKVEAGNWYLPEGAPWLDEWIDEYAAFPRGKFDDQVDMGSQVEARLIEGSIESSTRALLGLGPQEPAG